MHYRACVVGFGWLAFSLMACVPAEERAAAEREAVHERLEEYLPALGEAYRTRDFEPLSEWASQKEVATVRRRVYDLQERGRELHPRFRSVEVERVTIPGHSNAYVTTREIWDLRVYALGTDTVLSESLGQVSRVQYQLLRGSEGRWVVIARSVETILEDASGI